MVNVRTTVAQELWTDLNPAYLNPHVDPVPFTLEFEKFKFYGIPMPASIAKAKAAQLSS